MAEILYEDAQIAVCVKPVGILSQGETPNAMPVILSQQLGCSVFPVHRLDQAVGGVMVYAKTQKAAAALSSSMQKGDFHKEYCAVLQGVPQEHTATLEDLLFFDRSKNKSFVVKRKRASVKEASLSYEVLQSMQSLTLVRVRLHTGRTHQIRVQFASRKLPLLGDGKYGSADNRCTVSLWSARLSFPHPASGKTLEFSAPPPSQFPWEIFEKNEQ
ncbi:MAG: RluA family pseudouridine synthase [Oscillospiraceae bacterium]|nr:RluA family pseudouridine synthase [Oscillospiraceae bacterium]